MKKYGIDHVCILSTDVEATVKFYRELFGMEILKEAGEAPERKIWLDGGIQINEAAVVEKNPNAFDHIGFFVPVEEREEIMKKAESYGCRILKKAGSWFVAPDGLTIELSARNRTTE